MKTLDEVIKAMDMCITKGCYTDCPYERPCLYDSGNTMMKKDALHYLREYRDLLNRPRSERLIDVLREVRGEK